MYNLLIGTYSTPEKNPGIQVYSFNTENGEFHSKAEATGIKNPSYLAITNDRKHVYAVSEENQGSVSAFSFDHVSGKLTYINTAPSTTPIRFGEWYARDRIMNTNISKR